MKVLDFYADWCGPCQMMKPVMEELEEEYKGKVEFQQINIDDDPEMAEKYEVMSIPMLVFLNDEGEIIETMVGAQSKAAIQKVLDK